MGDSTIVSDKNNIEALFDKVSCLIEQARTYIATTVNVAEVYTKYYIGQYIVENEQTGRKRAQYGKEILTRLSVMLDGRFGHGWSVDTLEKCRKLFLVYSKSAAMLWKSVDLGKSETLSQIFGEVGNTMPNFVLTWSHYIILMRIQDENERNFYEVECANRHWNVRQLQRQYNSSLYERLALSRNKDGVIRLSKEGQTIEKPSDIIKNPLTLEFLELKPEASYSESRLEASIINKL